MKCPNCGTETNSNFCPNCGEPIRRKPHKPKKAGTSIASLFMVAIVVIAGIFIYNKVQDKAREANSATPVTKITKVKPSLTYEETLTGVKFTIQANDNYDEVQVVYKLYNNSNQIIKQNSLYGFNYRKGSSYVLSESFSVSELLSMDRIEYGIGYYK